MSHRDFVQKRAPHQAIAARFIPTYSYSGQTSDPAATAVPATSSSAKTTAAINPTPPAGTPQTSPASTISSSTPSSTPTSTSTTSTSLSSSRSSSSSALSTPPPQIPVATPPPVNTQVVPGTLTFTPSTPTTITTTTTTATSTPSSSSGPSTAAIVGGVAGALAAIAVLGFIIMWCMRRQRNRDNDDFDPSVFKRQSAILVDDPLEPPQTYNRRPPTMVERHNASPALAAQAGYGQNFYGNYGGYNQQSPYPSPEMNSYAGSPPPQQYGTAAMGYAYNEPPQGLGRQPSNPAYLTRQPSSVAGYGTLPPPPDAHYVDLNRSSVTPFQASQYADISSHLGTPNPNALAVQPKGPAPLSEEPLPSPFDDPAEVFPPPPIATATTSVNQSAAPAVQPRQNATQHTQRPTSAYTVYEEGDAYGGI